MAINVEWKARFNDLQRLGELAEQVAGRPLEVLKQIDTFFNVARGRLKLRRLSTDHGELIHYHRPDQAGPKQSTYSIQLTSEPDAPCETLAAALGVRAAARKRRWLYLAGPARIHLDEAEALRLLLGVEVVQASKRPS